MCPESRDDFEVAIICALPLEAAAVLDSLDQRYDKVGSKYGKQEGDTNTYSTGRIGQHNVVLAHMSGMGISSAARVASNLQLSFKGIRLALIVGVCGGAPLERPIVLGDVIISNSVVEFDFGRQYPDRFERKSGLKDTLGRPNIEIRGLLSKFEIPLIREELEETILQNLARLQEKRQTARYPGAEHDRLFSASYRHMHRRETASQDCLCISSWSNSDASCSEALESSCDTLGCVADVLQNPSRQMRFASGVPAPRVHIGTIGSASTVMKSGEHRDAIASKNNIIAFEMEGAGVWDALPCIVLKGVCDYSDSHKNKIWQDYAAATAASAAKAFLDYWTSRQHTKISGEASSRKRRLSHNSGDEGSVSNAARRTPGSKEQNAVISALPSTVFRPPPAFVDFGVRKVRLNALAFEHLDARQATIKTAHAATCEWLLSKSEYLEWQDEDKIPRHHGFLWIKGKPGAGKSTIMNFAYVNARKNSGSSVVISYFFNARGDSLEKSTIGMYRSLLFQLLSDIPRLQEVLDTREAIHLQTVSPDLWTTDTLQLLFRRAIEKLGGLRLTCFVDALDECENNEDQVREMVCFFEGLGECATTGKTRFFVCFSSRHYPHITIDKCVELTLETQRGHSEDVARYINSRLRVGRSKRADEIKHEMQEKAQGVFLWVILVVPMLQKAYDHGQVHALSECLKGIPRGLDELFKDILKRDAENLGNLKACLKWILYADRPLSAVELYLAILSTSSPASATTWDPEEVTAEDINRFILSSSKGLAEATRAKNPTIQFIHESVRDFLLKESGSALLAEMGLTSAGLVHDFLKHSCLRYLVSIKSSLVSNPSSMVSLPSSMVSLPSSMVSPPRPSLAVPMSNNKSMSRPIEAKLPFLRYSIYNVFKHAESAASLGVPQERFLEEFPLSHWLFLHDSSETSLLYVLTERNLLHLFQIEVCRSQSINVKGGRYDFPIIAAAVVGNEQMLEQLLRYGANHAELALQTAIDKCNAPAIAVLLKHATVSAANYRVPSHMLEGATRKRGVATMKLLLENLSILESPLFNSEVFENLVGIAIENGDQKMIGLFLDFGIINKENHYRLDYALYKAASCGNDALVLLLIQLGADINATTFESDTVHEVASLIENQSMRPIILWENGGDDPDPIYADFNRFSNRARSTALYSASAAGHQSVVRILLKHGADANKDSPLVVAVSSGYETITRMLLERGANPNCGYGNKLPLHVALERGETNIVRLLFDYGAGGEGTSLHDKGAFLALARCPNLDNRDAC